MTPLIRLAWVVAVLLLAACSSGLNRLKPSSTHTLTEGVSYGPLPRHKLDIYRPARLAPAGGWPVVVFFYGGSWTWGERAQYQFLGEALASRGVLTLVADYRLYPEVRYPDFLSDSAQAVAHGLREAARLGGNPHRVFAMGHSAGAYNAAMLALDARWLAATGHSPARLAGWVGLAGPYDFLPIENRDTQVAFRWPDTSPDSQPINHVTAQAPRTLLLAATSDSLVDPQRSTVGLGDKLKAAGVPVRVELYPRVNHVTLLAAMAQPLRWLAPVRAEVLDFLGLPD
ncbi:MAG TPA: alpha/beta hydrolase [Rhizobacter sp.]|nr:alpha/beta hydrolase [Rhizobacter sp.]